MNVIESVKTTCMETESAGILGKIKALFASENRANESRHCDIVGYSDICKYICINRIKNNQ